MIGSAPLRAGQEEASLVHPTIDDPPSSEQFDLAIKSPSSYCFDDKLA